MNSLILPFRWIVDFALPPRCPACGVIAPGDDRFCSGCWQKLHFLTQPACSLCDLPLPFATNGEQYCAACIAKPPRHNGVKAAVAYGDIAREVALRLKYGGKIGLARLIAGQLRRYQADLPANALLVPVPLHWTRLWTRSFNQSVLIAQEFGKLTGHRIAPDALVRTRRTRPLGGLSAKARRAMVKGAFEVRPTVRMQLDGADIILVDDVYTSGATTDACVSALKKAGARSVTILCWARVLPEALEVEEGLAAALD
jgi:ComF family protein